MVSRLWVVCPTYYDTKSYERVYREVKHEARKLPFSTLNFVIIDDSAGLDPEIERMKTFADVHVLAPPYNVGSQHALTYGLRSLGDHVEDDDFVITMDSDGEDRPSDIHALLKPLFEKPDNTHLVSIATRTQRKASPLFSFFYFFFKIFFRVLVGRIVKSGNFAAYRGWFLKEVIFHPNFDHVYASSFLALPLQIYLVPLPRALRYAGKSRMNYTNLFTHGFRMLMPFSEAISTRGLMFSILATCFTLPALLLFPGFISVALFLASFVSIFGFALIFVTTSQTKSRSVRALKKTQIARRDVRQTAPIQPGSDVVQ